MKLERDGKSYYGKKGKLQSVSLVFNKSQCYLSNKILSDELIQWVSLLDKYK